VVGQILMVQFGGRALRTQPLSPMQHLACIGISAITLIIAFIVKLIPFEVEETKKTGAYERFSLGMASRLRSRSRSGGLPTSKSIKAS
jgi:hypothetical protein